MLVFIFIGYSGFYETINLQKWYNLSITLQGRLPDKRKRRFLDDFEWFET